MTIALRDYQSRSLAAILSAHKAGRSRQLAVLPTGAGKTVVFCHAAREIGGRTLVLAHRDELLDQAIAKFHAIWPDTAVGKVRAGDNDLHHPVVVASVQTAARDNRLEELARYEWATIIVDEAHHAPARSYHKILNRLVRPETLLLGVTATPSRLDGQAIGQVFDEITARVTIDELVDQGYLVDCRSVRVRLGELDTRSVSISGGDYQTGDLGRQLASAGVSQAIAEAYTVHGEGRPAVIYLPTVDLAHDCAGAMRALGHPTGVVSGETPSDERQAIFAKLRTGELKAVSNCMVLTEGWDEPCVSCVIVGRPTRSAALYQQMVGRGLRLHPDKSDCLVIDVTGVERDPKQATLADLGGNGELDQDQLELVRMMIELLDKGVPRTEARDKAVKQFGSEAEQRELEARVKAAGREAFNWLRDHRGRYILSLGKMGTVVLWPPGQPGPGKPIRTGWSAIHLEPPTGYSPQRAPYKAIVLDTELSWCQGIGEELVRRYSSAGISKQAVRWRKDSATPGQVAYARRLGVPGASSMKKGELADALTLVLVSLRFDREPSYKGRPLERAA